MEKKQVAAVVMAGHSPNEKDPLAAYSMGRSKAMIPIAGRPMITYVIEALAGSEYVQDVIIVGLPPEECLPLPIPVTHTPDRGNMVDNACAGIEYAFAQRPQLSGALLVGSDVPLLTPAIVDHLVETCLETDHDLYYSIVERSVMEGRFPASRRTYVRLVDGVFAGGDLALLRPSALAGNQALWRQLARFRKNVLQLARVIGLRTMLRLLTRQLSLAEAEQALNRAVGLRIRAVVSPNAEVAMDVDKPFQLEIARAELEASRVDAAS